MSHSFEIGLTEAGMENLAVLEITVGSGESAVTFDVIVPEPEWTYQPYADEIMLGNGTVRGIGWPVVTWHWGYLTKNQYLALRVFCTGKSATVFIYTKTTTTEYETFTGTLIWPQAEDWRAGKVIDFELRFINLTVVEAEA